MNSNASTVIITLLKGVLYQEDSPALWNDLLSMQATVADYVAVLGLDLILDEAEGYAFLRSHTDQEEGDQPSIPRLVARRQLSYPVSLTLALLRKKLAEHDANGGEVRLILSRDEIVELIRIFLPSGSNEARLVDQTDTTINKIIDLGFIRRMRGSSQMFEVRRIIKAYIDAQWLSDFEARLTDYRKQYRSFGEGEEEAIDD